MLILLILGFLGIVALEVPAMAAAGQTKELRAFWVLLAISFLFSLAMVERWPLPNPTDFLEVVFRPMADALGLK